jgi:hypothetical protein
MVTVQGWDGRRLSNGLWDWKAHSSIFSRRCAIGIATDAPWLQCRSRRNSHLWQSGLGHHPMPEGDIQCEQPGTVYTLVSAVQVRLEKLTLGCGYRTASGGLSRVGTATFPKTAGGGLLDSVRVGCINSLVGRHAAGGRATVRKGRSINLCFHLILTYLLPPSMVAVQHPAPRRQPSPSCSFSHRLDGPRTRTEALFQGRGASSRGRLFIAMPRSDQGTP